MSYDNKGHVLHSPTSATCAVCGTAIGLVSELDPGEKLLSRHGKA